MINGYNIIYLFSNLSCNFHFKKQEMYEIIHKYCIEIELNCDIDLD